MEKLEVLNRLNDSEPFTAASTGVIRRGNAAPSLFPAVIQYVIVSSLFPSSGCVAK